METTRCLPGKGDDPEVSGGGGTDTVSYSDLEASLSVGLLAEPT